MKRFYILIIENSLTYPIQDDLNKFFDWISRKTGISVLPEYIKTQLPLTHKDFGIKVADKSYWGLGGIKQQLRNTERIEDDYYHCVFFLYNLKGWDSTKGLAAWTYPQYLYNAAFTEIPVTPEWETTDEIYRMLTHEFLHQLHRLMWKQGIITKDTMDKYDDEAIVESPTGNRARNLETLNSVLSFLKEPRNRVMKPILESLLEKLIQLRDLLIRNKTEMKPMLDRWVDAIKEYEGYFPGSRSFRNNNPGNLKFAGQHGTTGKDDKNFAIFKDYDSGYKALRSQLKLAASGGSKYYKPDMSLIGFFEIFAPVHENDSHAYAVFVAGRLGIDPKTQIKNLL